MAKRPLEDMLATALRDLDGGKPATGGSGQNEQPALSEWLDLHERLDAPPRLSPPTLGSTWGKQRMLAALAAPPVQAGGLRMIASLIAMVPKAAMVVIGGLVLTGSAVGASAAAGGPNVPMAVLAAVGLHSDDHSSGIGNAPDAAETGKDHADERAFAAGRPDFSSCEGLTGGEYGACVAGIALAQHDDADAAGAEHASATAALAQELVDQCREEEGRAFGKCVRELALQLGAPGEADPPHGEADLPHGKADVPHGESETGLENAHPNASDGAANASEHGDNRVNPTLPEEADNSDGATLPEQAGSNAPEEGSTGLDHASEGAANAEGRGRP